MYTYNFDYVTCQDICSDVATSKSLKSLYEMYFSDVSMITPSANCVENVIMTDNNHIVTINVWP